MKKGLRRNPDTPFGSNVPSQYFPDEEGIKTVPFYVLRQLTTSQYFPDEEGKIGIFTYHRPLPSAIFSRRTDMRDGTEVAREVEKMVHAVEPSFWVPAVGNGQLGELLKFIEAHDLWPAVQALVRKTEE